MSKILVKGIMLYSRNTDYHSGPNIFGVVKTYRDIDEFLRKDGQSLPFIEELGTITPPLTPAVSISSSLYVINDCLITNRANPWLRGYNEIVHIIQGVGRLEDKLKIDKTLDLLKIKTGRWNKYWENYGYGDEKIINVPEKLRNIEELISYIPKLMKLTGNTLILPNMKKYKGRS